MVQTNSDKRTDGWTHASTPNYHCDNYVSLNASGLDKSWENWSQIWDVGASCTKCCLCFTHKKF